MKLSEKELKELYADYTKYEKYIYSILGTKDYHSKVGKSKRKVNIYDAKMLGMDFEDLVQQGREFLWEALLRYGKPTKNGNKPKNVASKSTFVFTHLTNMFKNLGIKASSSKFKRVDIDITAISSLANEITPEDMMIFEEKYEDKLEKERTNNKKYLEKMNK